jgi:hypothetical protein
VKKKKSVIRVLPDDERITRLKNQPLKFRSNFYLKITDKNLSLVS